MRKLITSRTTISVLLVAVGVIALSLGVAVAVNVGSGIAVGGALLIGLGLLLGWNEGT